MNYLIRPARRDDVESISRVIVSALRSSNAKDYPEAVIARVEKGFSPVAVSDLLARRIMFVAVIDDAVVGTASFDGLFVRTFFIDPACQDHGIGRALMAEVGRAAVESGIQVLSVRSSITAEPFNEKMGFISVRDNYYGEERTIVMERPLSGLLKDC